MSVQTRVSGRGRRHGQPDMGNTQSFWRRQNARRIRLPLLTKPHDLMLDVSRWRSLRPVSETDTRLRQAGNDPLAARKPRPRLGSAETVPRLGTFRSQKITGKPAEDLEVAPANFI